MLSFFLVVFHFKVNDTHTREKNPPCFEKKTTTFNIQNNGLLIEFEKIIGGSPRF
jgi:hypothetical protein